MQLDLFDQQGFVPFKPQTDSIPVDANAGEYKVGDMRIQLQPTPNNLDRALTLVMDCLVLISKSQDQWGILGDDDEQVISLDSWTCSKCSVTFRSNEDKGVVRAKYSRCDDHLEISLPCRKSWPENGLAWLLRLTPCCSREVNNPTPWLGKQCGCK